MAELVTPNARQEYPWARIANIILGVWLFISAFIWPHTQAQMTNTWIIGAITVGLALIALAVPNVRYLNAALAVWLFISAFALRAESVGTVWNNALVAIAIFFIALVPSSLEARLGGPRRRVAA